MILTFASSVSTFYYEVFFFATRKFYLLQEAPIIKISIYTKKADSVWLLYEKNKIGFEIGLKILYSIYGVFLLLNPFKP